MLVCTGDDDDPLLGYFSLQNIKNESAHILKVATIKVEGIQVLHF